MPQSRWKATYDELLDRVDAFNSDVLFFRGHADSSWQLLPSLSRSGVHAPEHTETVAYYDFLTRAGDLIDERASSWSTLLSMQHHGVPTRLLDWTETLGVALYFAVREGSGDAAVWILNPFTLNRLTTGSDTLPLPHELECEYAEFLSDDCHAPNESKVLAISALRHNPRVNHQRGGFTLHYDLQTPLDQICPDAIAKVVIPGEARAEVQRFLSVAGISEFSLFPDLDGLAREIVRQHFPHIWNNAPRSVLDRE